MGRPETTASLSKLLEKYIHAKDSRIYWAKEVTFEYGSIAPIRVDYMRFKPVNNTVSGVEKGDFYCYEIKSSAEDYRSKHGHNFIGDYNYYVMPKEVYEAVKTGIPFDVGVLAPDEYGIGLEVIKKVKRRDRDRPAVMMLLMMYRSFARDEHKGG